MGLKIWEILQITTIAENRDNGKIAALEACHQNQFAKRLILKRTTQLEKTDSLFASGYQLQIASCLEVGPNIPFTHSALRLCLTSICLGHLVLTFGEWGSGR